MPQTPPNLSAGCETVPRHLLCWLSSFSQCSDTTDTLHWQHAQFFGWHPSSTGPCLCKCLCGTLLGAQVVSFPQAACHVCMEANGLTQAVFWQFSFLPGQSIPFSLLHEFGRMPSRQPDHCKIETQQTSHPFTPALHLKRPHFSLCAGAAAGLSMLWLLLWPLLLFHPFCFSAKQKHHLHKMLNPWKVAGSASLALQRLILV